MTNRLIKHEVIDISDRLEQMHSEMKKQDDKINTLKHHMKYYFGVNEVSHDNYDEGEGEKEESKSQN